MQFRYTVLLAISFLIFSIQSSQTQPPNQSNKIEFSDETVKNIKTEIQELFKKNNQERIIKSEAKNQLRFIDFAAFSTLFPIIFMLIQDFDCKNPKNVFDIVWNSICIDIISVGIVYNGIFKKIIGILQKLNFVKNFLNKAENVLRHKETTIIMCFLSILFYSGKTQGNVEKTNLILLIFITKLIKTLNCNPFYNLKYDTRK